MAAPDDDILTRGQREWPMPQGELDRLQLRRPVLSYVPQGGVGAEIGVFRGHFSELLCQVVRPQRLYLIDPWTTIGATFGWGKAYTAFGALPTAQARDEAVARTAAFPGTRTVVIEGTYPACRDRIPEPLDFAYLDASHSYAATLAELRALDSQVRPGGTILGDDWDPRPEAQHHGVFRAVQQFCRESDWRIVMAGPGRQWALRRYPDG